MSTKNKDLDLPLKNNKAINKSKVWNTLLITWKEILKINHIMTLYGGRQHSVNIKQTIMTLLELNKNTMNLIQWQNNKIFHNHLLLLLHLIISIIIFIKDLIHLLQIFQINLLTSKILSLKKKLLVVFKKWLIVMIIRSILQLKMKNYQLVEKKPFLLLPPKEVFQRQEQKIKILEYKDPSMILPNYAQWNQEIVRFQMTVHKILQTLSFLAQWF